ncbi:MAG: hypothetical protein EHM19_02205 [Candidatus Latescibacterota bacterium]|nr:MAG: hypothetical protein EHM19_02205 [Candidatus Latescibacterota bacterium]
MRFPKSAWIWTLSCLLAAAGCGDDETSPTGPSDGSDQVVLQLENFGDPSPYHYGLWAVEGSDATLIVRFRVLDGGPATLAGEPIASIEQEEALGGADRILITLESDTLGSAPSAHVFAAGAVSEGAAALTLANASALGVDLSSAAGAFLFDAPTTATATDCGRGVWWTDGAGNPGLTLPALGAAWRYEGWVVERTSGASYSTGRFAGPSGADTDGPGATGGGGAGYAFPGQDFVTAAGGVPVLDLDDGSFAVAVTLEPNPDLSAEPFFLHLLDTNAGSGNLFLTVSTLPRLPDGAHYRIWASFDDSLVSIGGFLYRDRKIVDVESLEEIAAFPIGCGPLAADGIRISVETDGGPAEPSGSFLLAGSIEDGEAALTTQDPLAFGHAYQESDLRFVLETPSTASTGDYRRGLWFFEATGGETTATLASIPEAPDGWRYQAWVQRVLAPLDTFSVGGFTNPSAPDDDGAGPFAGPDGPLPNVPGQDFVTGTALDLDNGTYGVLVSIEPEIDLDPSGVFLPLFQDIDIDAVGQGTTQGLGSLFGTLPSGTIRLEGSEIVTMAGRGNVLPRARVVFGKK